MSSVRLPYQRRAGNVTLGTYPARLHLSLSRSPPLTNTPTHHALYVSPSVSLSCPAVSSTNTPPPATDRFLSLIFSSVTPPPSSSIYHFCAHLFPHLVCPSSPFPPPFHLSLVYLTDYSGRTYYRVDVIPHTQSLLPLTPCTRSSGVVCLSKKPHKHITRDIIISAIDSLWLDPHSLLPHLHPVQLPPSLHPSLTPSIPSSSSPFHR